MKVRWDGLGAGSGGMKSFDSPRFGMTRDGGTRPHGGLDLEAPVGTPIYAIADGVIERVRMSHPKLGTDVLLKFKPLPQWCAYLAQVGNRDNDGVLFAHYAHLSSVHVSEEQKVFRGMYIGQTGVSGNADLKYPHLHFEVRKTLWAGLGKAGLLNRIDPELMFRVDFSKPVETLERVSRTA